MGRGLPSDEKKLRMPDGDSVTSITSRSTMSLTDGEGGVAKLLGPDATIRMSLVAAKAVRRLKEKLVTAQLRDRLREHRHKHHPESSEQETKASLAGSMN